MRTNLLNCCNLVSISKNVVFYVWCVKAAEAQGEDPSYLNNYSLGYNILDIFQ